MIISGDTQQDLCDEQAHAVLCTAENCDAFQTEIDITRSSLKRRK
jgi:hypothetical protein